MNFENALYYTFSTVAQSLGAAISLLGAFVLLRYQMINATLQLAAKTAMRGALLDQEVGRLGLIRSITGNYDGLIAVLRKPVDRAVQAGNVGGADAAAAALTQISLQLEGRTQLMKDFRWALITSITLMGLAVLALGCTPVILKYRFEFVALAFAVVCFVGTLAQFGILMYRQLNQDSAESSKTRKKSAGVGC